MPRSDDELQVFVDGAPVHRAPPQAPADAKDEPLPLLRFTEWQDRPLPAREWIVEGWIPSGHVTALYGDGGTGKSLLAQQLMTACAIGRPWIGLGVERCRSIGLFCEDDEAELLRRQAAINAGYGVEMRDLGDMVTIAGRVGGDNTLMSFDRESKGVLTPLWHRLRGTAIDHRARLAVIDTAADTFGGNELARSEARRFIATCLGALARDIGGAVLLCAHPSVRGMADGTGSGGSTGWSNTVRGRIYLARPKPEDDAQPDPDARRLTRIKANYAPIGENIPLRWERGVLRPEGPGSSGLVEAIDKRNHERAAEEAFLACLAKVPETGRHASASRNSQVYAPKLFSRMQEGAGLSKRQFERAMERLFDAGKIRVETITTSSRHSAQAIVVVV